MYSELLPSEELIDEKTHERRLWEVFEGYVNDLLLTETELQGELLDVGAGEGEFVEYLRTVLHNVKAKAVDKSSWAIKDENKDWYIQGNARRLPFEDNSFDTITARHCMGGEPFEDIIFELLRVVRENGRVIFTLPTPERERALKADAQARFGEDYDINVVDGVQYCIDWDDRIQDAVNCQSVLRMLSKAYTVKVDTLDPHMDVVAITNSPYPTVS